MIEMVQVLDKEKEHKYSIKLEEIIILEELPIEEEQVEKPIVVEQEKPRKKALSKLMEKAKYNANYFKDVKKIEDVRNKRYSRNYTVY